MYHSELLILRNGWEEPLHPAGKTPVYNVLEAQNICFIELVMVFLKTKFMCIQLWFSITIICLLQNYATNYFVSNCLRECTPIHSFFISTWSNKHIKAFFQNIKHIKLLTKKISSSKTLIAHSEKLSTWISTSRVLTWQKLSTWEKIKDFAN